MLPGPGERLCRFKGLRVKAFDIITLIESMAPPGFAASWDHSGVQVAAPREDIGGLAVVLDPTLESLGRAADTGADFILSHHPLLLRPRYPDRADEYLSILSLLLGRGIWLYSAHTTLDANPEGPVRWLAHELGLQSLEILESAARSGADAPRSGFGFCGVLPTALPYEDFCSALAAAMNRHAWQACGPKPSRVFRVACCPGSGSGLLADAAASGADVFITGDVKYHAALEAGPLGLRVLDVGHFALEEEMMRRFAAQLALALPLPVRFVPGGDPVTVEESLPKRPSCGTA